MYLAIQLLQRGSGWQVLWVPVTACGFWIGGKVILIYQAGLPYTDLVFVCYKGALNDRVCGPRVRPADFG